MSPRLEAAAAPRAAADVRILVVRPGGATGLHRAVELPRLLEPGDLVVVNDAATLPASLQARTSRGETVEIRLASTRSERDARFAAALLGAGDHRTRTEDRPPPPRLAVGDELSVGEDLVARVVRISPVSTRLVDITFRLRGGAPADVWAALYRAGRPVQYAHVPRPLALWDVQNAWASRPWAVEMPSAGRALRTESILALRGRGVGVARITHAAGLSSTGDPAIDASLPLPERFDVPEETARAVVKARLRGGRVVAIGTSVVRALESAARLSGRAPFAAARGITDLVLGPETPRMVVDAVVTGVHEPDTSHFALLGAFASRPLLDHALALAARERMLGHELGDAWLVWGAPRRASATFAA